MSFWKVLMVSKREVPIALRYERQTSRPWEYGSLGPLISDFKTSYTLGTAAE